jgi:hypothetical protein
MSHEFKTGSTGFYGTGKIINPENSKARYQICVNITLIGIKLRTVRGPRKEAKVLPRWA